MNTFGLSIVASDKVFFRGRGINIVIPAQDGQVSILAHHADMMITVVPGEMRFQTEDEQWHEAIVGNGFAQIINNRVSLFADSIEKPEDIDEKRAKEASADNAGIDAAGSLFCAGRTEHTDGDRGIG